MTSANTDLHVDQFQAVKIKGASPTLFSQQWVYPGDRLRTLRPGFGRSELQTELLFERCIEVREFFVGGVDGKRARYGRELKFVRFQVRLKV
jgi:hypothetical protein